MKAHRHINAARSTRTFIHIRGGRVLTRIARTASYDDDDDDDDDGAGQARSLDGSVPGPGVDNDAQDDGVDVLERRHCHYVRLVVSECLVGLCCFA